MTEVADGPDPDPNPGPNTIHVYPADGIEKANNAPAWSIVILHAGIYSEPLIPINSNVIFQAAPGEVPVIDGKGTGKSGIILNQLSYIALDGLTIQNWSNLGNAQGCKRFKIKNCHLTNGHTSGFWANTSEDCEITGNTIDHCGTGKGDDCLALQDCTRFLIADNHVSRGAHAGIQALHCQNIRILRNTVEHCGSSGIIAKVDFNDGEVTGNFVSHSAYSNESSEGRRDAGIQIVGSRNLISHNRVNHCGGGIILALDADQSRVTNENRVEFNTIYDSEECGLDLASYGAKGIGRMQKNSLIKNIVWGSHGVDLRLQIVGGGIYGSNSFDRNVAATVQVMEGNLPPHDTTDPVLDLVTLTSKTFPDRGWQG